MGQRFIDKGGEKVIQKTIQAVQEAEAKAADTLKQADDKASEVLAKANQKAGELKEAVVNEAQERAEKRMETLKVKLKEEEGAFDADTQKEVDALRAIADQREAQAVEMILRELT